jgi:hypothetical protein
VALKFRNSNSKDWITNYLKNIGGVILQIPSGGYKYQISTSSTGLSSGKLPHRWCNG